MRWLLPLAGLLVAAVRLEAPPPPEESPFAHGEAIPLDRVIPANERGILCLAADHGAIAGYRTYEEPRHAEDLNKGTKEKVRYARQVSRAIAIDPGTGAYTAGANGVIYRYDFQAQKLEKLDLKLPATPGRESWASL